MENKLQDNIVAAVLGGLRSDAVLKAMKAEIPQASTYKGVVTVEIPFELSKGEDGEALNTASILSQAVLAKAVRYSGITGEAFKNGLRQAATEALLSGDKVAEVLTDEVKAIVAVMDEIKAEVIAQLPMQKKQGSVRVKATPKVESVTLEKVS